MFNLAEFNKLPDHQKKTWLTRAEKLKYRDPRTIGTDDLRACMWYVNTEFHKWQKTPPVTVEELHTFMAFQRWLLDIRREWIERAQRRKSPLYKTVITFPTPD